MQTSPPALPGPHTYGYRPVVSRAENKHGPHAGIAVLLTTQERDMALSSTISGPRMKSGGEADVAAWRPPLHPETEQNQPISSRTIF
jgi:hypothetical protein